MTIVPDAPLVPPRCPLCVGEAQRHCANPLCDWVVCRRCEKFGTPGHMIPTNPAASE